MIRTGRDARVVICFVAVAAEGACGARTGLLDAPAPPPSRQVVLVPDASPASCTGLCERRAACDSGQQTTLTGTAFVPSGVDPLSDAVVYVPNGPVAPFRPGVACAPCGAPVTGDPLVATRSGADGTFVLANVPAGANVPLVIQSGRWRRQVVVPEVMPCASNAVDPRLTRLPRNQGEGDIPLMALATGSADPLECALRRVGLDDVEFTAPTDDGRVHVWVNDGAVIPGAPDASMLPPVIASYDLVFMDCTGLAGASFDPSPFAAYTAAGGRVFSSHFGYGDLLNPPFASTFVPSMPPDDGAFPGLPGSVDTSTADGQTFLQWLGAAGALNPDDTVTIQQPKEDVESAILPAQTWLTTSASSPMGATAQLFSFDTPVGQDPSTQCGSFVFSAYHVSDTVSMDFANPNSNVSFPDECVNEPMTATEKAFEFLLFRAPTCAP